MRRKAGRQDKKSSRNRHALGGPGSDLLSRVLRRSTIGAGAFHGRVRNGTGCSRPAITTRSAKRISIEKLAGSSILENGVDGTCRQALRFKISTPHRATRKRPIATRWAQAMRTNQADRAISTGKLHMSPCFHTRPINVVVFHDSQGLLVSWSVSRLDAFSGYPFHT